MEDAPFNLATMSIELIITIVVIGFISLCMFLGSNVTKAYQREADVANSMEEYALFSKYDGTVVSGSDVVEAIYAYAENGFGVRVGGNLFSSAPDLLAELIDGAGAPVNLDRNYEAELEIDAGSGQISGIEFVAAP